MEHNISLEQAVTQPDVESTIPDRLKSTPHRIPSLDGLRALSIALVVFGHMGGTLPWHSHFILLLFSVFGNGELGVMIFFVISGFLITTLLLNEESKTGRIDLKQFYIRRSLRILPAFYLYFLVVSVLWWLGKIHLAWSDYLPSLLFLRDYAVLFGRHVPSGDWFVGHIWSLSIEEQFYWLWPIGLIFMNKNGAKKLAVTLLVLSPILRIAQYFFTPDLRTEIPIMFHTRMDSIMTGCLAAILYREPKFNEVLSVAYRSKAPIAAAIFMFVISPLISLKLKGVYLLPVGWSIENGCAGMILLWAIDNSETTIGRLLNSRALVHLGLISYGLYLWQQLFLTGLNTTFTGKFPLNVLFALLAAELSFTLVELPIQRLRKRLQPAC